MKHFKNTNTQGVICPVCGNRNGNLTQDTALSVYVCVLCGHSFTLLPKSGQEIYDENYFAEDHENWFSHPNTKLFKSIGDKIRSYFGTISLSLLDVGCGNGDLLLFLKAHYDNMAFYGIDLASRESREREREREITFVQGDFFMHDFNRKFDVLTSLMSIEHIDNPVLFVRKICDALEPGGVVVVTTINSNSFIYRLARIFKTMGLRATYERLYNHHHLQHYTNDSLKVLLENANFKIMYHKNHNFPIAAIDLPKSSALIKWIYKTGVVVIFALTSVFGGGMNQTLICCKKEYKHNP